MTTTELVETHTQKREEEARSEEINAAPLFDEHEANDLRTRWQHIQGTFVDDPHGSVEQADKLVATAIQRLAEVFAEEKSRMEATWSKGSDVSTEDMRQALRRYRSFFDRILTV